MRPRPHKLGKPLLFTAPKAFLISLLVLIVDLLLAAQLPAASAPSITTQPQSQDVLAGTNAAFSVVASGQTPFFYQWLFNGTNLTNNSHWAGATNSTLTISNVTAADHGNYQVIVSNSHGSTTSSNATLNVFFPPQIAIQPTNTAVLINGIATFAAGASGTAPLNYQWYFNGAALSDGGRLSGATLPTLSIANLQTNDSGSYQLVVTNSYGSAASTAATLTVLVPPFIVAQPSNQVAMLGSNATLRVVAGGTAPLSYQWYYNGTSLIDGGRLSGSLTPALSIANVQSADAGFYQVVVANSCGSVTSSVAVLGTSAVAPGVVRFVSPNSANPAAPYTDWSIAATNIQDAVDASTDGDFIFVTNGVYTARGRATADGNTNGIVATNSITIQSVNGAAATLLNGLNLMRCANISNAILAGFTLTNGNAGSGGGAVGGTLNNCLLVGNNVGGAYYAILNNCTVLSNSAVGVGYSTLSNCLISGNSGSGAGACMLYNCVLQNNNAAGWQGGGANLSTLNNCLMSGNLATYGGGASSSTLNNCVLSNNTASWGGGAIFSTLNNCLVVANVAHNHYADYYSASLGGGVWSGTANNCTIVGNSVFADENSSGLYYSGGGAYGSALNNCIIYFNSEHPYAHDSASNYGGGTQTNCCTTPLPGSGSGNFTSDPLLVNPFGGDYHLQTNSPCINAGNNAFIGGPTDLDGNPRIIGEVVDAGAYEFLWPTWFTLQPQSQSVNAGQSVFFSGAATGPLPLTYQWLFNGAAIAGATGSSLTLTNAQLANDGAYSLMVSNSAVVLVSTNAMLSVIYPPPGIVSQPAGLTVLAGTSVQISVTATSQVAMTFQWLLDGTNLVDGGNVIGSTNALLNISSAQGSNAGDYQVIVMNGFGAVTSTVATLTVLVPATILSQPLSQSVVLSNAATFTAVVDGTPPLLYQWYFNGAPLADSGRLTGSTTPALSIRSVLTNDAGNYQLIVTNNYGAATSQVATLAVLLPPMIVSQPTNQTVQPGSNVTMAVTAIGPGTLGYQWLFNGNNLADGGRISGSSTAVLSILNAQATDNGTYQVIVSNTNGIAASAPALLTVLAPPVITQQPPNLFEPLNGSALISAAADGAPPLIYQWYFNGAPLSDNARITGSVTPTLAVSSLQTNDQGPYQLVVTNTFGSVTSSVAALHILSTAWSPSSVISGWGQNDVGELSLPADATNIVALAGGYNHALALRADGTVEAWGESYLGATSVPTGLSNVVAIAAGDNHSLALKNDGTVVAWGDNSYGEINVPGGLSNVVAIAAGDFFSLALKSDGTVTGWGNNGNSQLSEANSANGIVALAANPVNTGYAMGLKTDRTVVEWGLYLPPIPAGVTNVIQIAVGGSHYLALKADGTVIAWGNNSSGQTNVPPGLSNVAAIAAGSDVSLALKADGSVVVWGGDSGGNDISPFGLTNVTAIASGGEFNLALNNGAPSLVAWPTNQAVFTGMSATFNTAVVSQPIPNFIQWQLNGTNLPGQNGPSLTLTNIQLTDAGTYSVLVTNVYGTVSTSAILAVSAAAPIILQQPGNQVVAATSNAVFAVSATGSLPLSYQWQCSNTNLPGATDSTLIVIDTQMNQSGLVFDVVVTNAFGVTVSSNAMLSVVPALVTVQPQNLTTNGGANVTFTSTVVGQGPSSYQWQFNGTNLAGATNSTFTLTNALASQSGAYTLVVSNSFGSATSAAAMLTVVPWISISISPTTIISGAGTVVAYSFNVGGLSPVNFQWTLNGAPWPGPGPGATMDIIDPPVSSAGTYNVTAKDAYASVTSSNVTLTIIPLQITGQPQSRGAWLGSTTQLRVTAVGASPLTYQWQLYGTNLPGASGNVLTISNVQASELGPYDVVVSNPYTNLVSTNATLALSQVAVWGAINGETNLPTTLTNIIAISAAGAETPDCQALNRQGTIVLWPGNSPGLYLQPATNLIAIAGAYPGFGLRPNGFVVQYPSAGSGIISGLSNVVAISSSGNGYLALKANGNVAMSASATGPPPGLSNVVAVAQGGSHSLALKLDGTVAAWGNNSYGQTTVPAGLSNVVAIAAGGYHSLALKSDSTVAGWGLNTYGEAHIPTGLSNVVAIAVGAYHSLALRANGTVVAWGYNANGQTNVPPNLTNIISIAAGQYQSMALIGPGLPVTQALLTAPSFNGNTFNVALPTQSGRVYGLEYKNSLSNSNWTLLPLVPGNGSSVLLTDPAATNAQRSYRVQRW